MKNERTRAYRRYMKWVKFKRRVDLWTQGTYTWQPHLRDEWRKEIFEGKSCTWLRTTGRPCNCYMCTYEKYEREPKYKWLKEAYKDIDDMAL